MLAEEDGYGGAAGRETAVGWAERAARLGFSALTATLGIMLCFLILSECVCMIEIEQPLELMFCIIHELGNNCTSDRSDSSRSLALFF